MTNDSAAPARAESVPAPTRYWLLPLGRTIVAAIVALGITFTANHSATVGLLALATLALLSGLSHLASAARRPEARGPFVAIAAVSLLVGAAAAFVPQGGLPYLVFLLSGWAAVTGILELYAGLRYRRQHAAARDWTFIGAITVLLAVVTLVIPPDLRQSFGGIERVQGELTASVVVVGVLGAYAALVAVFLGISALSLLWAERDARKAAES